MSKLRLDLWYIGTNFVGYQIQTHGRTVEGELKKALNKVYKENVRFISAGRTDTGVHALQQTVGFEPTQTIPSNGLMKALNSILPDDIRVTRIKKESSSFDARRDAKSREYRYWFTDQPIPVYLTRFITSVSFKLDRKLLNQVVALWVGEHDFVNFRKKGSNETTTIRQVFEASIKLRRSTDLYTGKKFQFYEIRIRANSFVYRMIRNLIGAMFEVVLGTATVDDYIAMLRTGRKKYHYCPAPAEGLCLTQVNY